MNPAKDGTKRANIHYGLEVGVVLKADQSTGYITPMAKSRKF